MAVVLHSKPGCGYCDRAADFLRDLGVPFTKRTYDPGEPDYERRRDALFAAHGHRSFPHVFVGDVFVGGFQELLEAQRRGDLERWLWAIGVTPFVDF